MRDFDKELLLAYVLGLSRTQLLARKEWQLTTIQQKYYQDLLFRLEQGEPVAYILGKREFWSLELEVTPDTLIPRPETELLVELAINTFSTNEIIKVADLGVGSGAIALAIANEKPYWQITATDYSAAALAVAKRNAERLKINNINFYLSNWCDALPKTEKFHLIVSNPPYISANDPHLKELIYEPKTALISGNDGLDDIKIIISQAKSYLLPSGWLMLEHGYDQGEAVKQIFQQTGYSNIAGHTDLAGIWRVTVGQV